MGACWFVEFPSSLKPLLGAVALALLLGLLMKIVVAGRTMTVGSARSGSARSGSS